MSETLREYLVSLGFNVDEQSYRRFNEGIARSAKNVTELGAETVTAATAIGIAVEKVARQFEALYYTSQRTGSAVVNLKAYEFGSRQIGVSADAARASVEGMAAAVRTNPGLAGLLRGMGIDPNNAQEAVVGLVGRMKATFGEGGYFVAQNMASMFGIDETTFRQMWMNFDRLKEAQEDHKRRAREAGVETEDTTAKFLAFSRALNLLEDDLAIVGQRIAQDFVDPATKAVEVIDQVIQAISRLDKETGGAAGFFGTLATTGIGAILAKRLVKRLFGFGSKAAGAAEAAEGGVAEAAGAAGSSLLLRAMGPVGMLLGSTDSTAGKADDEPMSAEYRAKHSGAFSGSASGSDARSQVMKFFMDRGWSREAAAGIAANIQRESSFNPRAVGDRGTAFGLSQWHEDRQAAFRKIFGKDIHNSSIEEQLAFIQHELTSGDDVGARRAGQMLKSAKSASEAAQLFSRSYERPYDPTGSVAQSRAALADNYFNADLGASTKSSGNVSLTQKTDIHVAAGPTSQATAHDVLSAQTRVNDDLVRNTAGAVR